MEAQGGEPELGPIDVVVIAYPADAPMTGDAAPLLVDLVERGIIRVLDVMFVIKNEDGTFSGFDATDLDGKGVGEFTVFEGASSGLLGDEDVALAADVIEPGTAAVMIVYENRWAGPFVAAVRRNGGIPVAFERVPAQDLIDALDAAEAASGVLTERTESCQDSFAASPARPSIAGTATAVSNRVSRRQANRWAQQERSRSTTAAAAAARAGRRRPAGSGARPDRAAHEARGTAQAGRADRRGVRHPEGEDPRLSPP